MADDFDVEAMLEEPYRQKSPEAVPEVKSSSASKRRSSREKDSDRDREKRRRSRSKDRERKRSSDRDKDRDRNRDRRSDRDREKDRERDRDSKRSSRHDDEKRDRDKDKHRDRDSERERERERHRKDREGSSRHGRKRSMSPVRPVEPDLTPEERDARTIFCMQLAARIRPKDLEEFFSAVGKVKDVRLITDNKSHRSKGISYVEFADVDSVALAIGLSGQKLLGVPIIVQPSHAERNRMASAQAAAIKQATSGPMRLYVGSLHYNITEDMLRTIFEPFGRMEDLKLMKDHNTGASAGYGFVTFCNSEDAKKAMDQMNGFELAGRPMKVSNITDRTGEDTAHFDVDEQDRMGFGLGATGRLHLMAKLAEGTGMQIPQAAANVLGSSSAYTASMMNQTASVVNQVAAPPISTQCFMLSNMFDPARETSPTWEQEVRDDVLAECNKHGGVVHIFVDRASPTGNVYVKCPTITAAVASVNSLHGRFFAGKVITAAYVPLPNYTSLFPNSANAMQLVMPSGGMGGVNPRGPGSGMVYN